MAETEIKARVSADVSQAVKGFNQLEDAVKKLPKGAQQATFALTNFSRVAQDAPFGLIGIANNIEPLIGSFVALKKETGSTAGAFKALGSSLMGGGGLILLVGLASAAMTLYGMASRGAKKDTDDLTDSKKSLAKVSEEVAKSTGGELANLQSLIAIASDETLSREARNEAMKEMNRLYPESIGNMKVDANTTKVLADLYPQLSKAILDQARARAIAAEIDASVARQRKLEAQDLEDNLSIFEKGLAILKGGGGAAGLNIAVQQAFKNREDALEKERQLQIKLGQEILKTNTELAKSGNLFRDKDINIKPKSVKITPEKVVMGTENIAFDEIEVPTNRFSVADMLGKIRNPIGDLVQPYNEVAEAAKLLQERNQKIADGVTNQLSPAFTGFFEDLLSGSKTTFADFGKAILGVIKKLVAAAAAAAVLALIIGAATGGANFGGGAGTLIGGMKNLFGGMTGIGLSANPGTGTGALMGAARGGSSGQLQAVVRGQDLLLVMRRASDDKNRLG